MATEKTENKAPKKSDSLIEGLFGVGAHYGYSKSRRHPSFRNFIFGTKEGTDVIDLEKTSTQLGKALIFLKESVGNGKTILFVGTKPEIRGLVEESALALGAPYVIHRWIGGLITNFSEMKKRVKRLDDLVSAREKGELDVYTKVERMNIEEEIADLLKNFGGITAMTRVPDVLFVVDSRHEHTAVLEARKKRISVIALTSSDGDLDNLDYVIPANDSHIESVSFIMDKVKEAYQEGRHARTAFLEAKEKSEEKKG